MVRVVTDKPQTTSKEHLAADGVIVHRSTVQHALHKEQLNERVMREKPFLHTHRKQSRLGHAKACLDKPDHFGFLETTF